MRRTGWFWLFLLLMCLCAASPALGESAYAFNTEGIRLYLPEDWPVLTAENLADREQQIAALGTTKEALSASFLSEGILLETFPPEGGQIYVKMQPLPGGIGAQDAYAMTAQQREAFLNAVAGAFGFAPGAWSDKLPEFALFRKTASLQSLPVHTIAYATARYGQVYLVSADIIGREPSEVDEAALFKAASSLLFLGARLTPKPEAAQAPRATLHLAPTPTPAPAEIRVGRDETYLELDYAPSTSHVSKLILTGTTEPNTPLRYYVNNQGYDRTTSDDQGRFTIQVRTLPRDGKNVVAVHAIGEKGYGIVSFTVILDQARSPLAVTPVTEGVADTAIVITGAVLPGSTVQVIQKSKTYQAQVAEDGGFSCQVLLNRVGENAFTVRAMTPGYLRCDESITVLRSLSPADEQAAFLKKLKSVPYDKLASNPGKYEGYAVRFKGRVLSLSGSFGQPLAVIFTENSANPVVLAAKDLTGLEIGREIDVLCEMTGALRTVSLNGEQRSVPEANLRWLLPDGQ